MAAKPRLASSAGSAAAVAMAKFAAGSLVGAMDAGVQRDVAAMIDDATAPHRYYYQPYVGGEAGAPGAAASALWSPQLLGLPSEARPLPRAVADAVATAEVGVLRGLFVEIHRAW